jgi:pyruvate dehydrogenase E2 component (dihydrolipoamide acetyltransferase)
VFTLPDVGEGLTEAEILGWRVTVGDVVSVNQVLVEIETAKAAVELPSPYAGTVVELLAEPGVTVEVGAPLVAIGDAVPDGGRDEPTPMLVGSGPKPSARARRPRRAGAPAPARVAEESTEQPATVPLAKPPVRKLARDLGVDLREVAGSGPNGAVTRDDVLASRGAGRPTGEAVGGRRVPIRGVRKATAAAMVASAFTAPHVTEFLTVDVTPMMALRERLRHSAEYRDVKLTPLSFAAKAVCLAVRRTPELNASWDDDAQEIVYHERVQLGIAAATPRGLVVPKVRDADRLGLRELAAAIGALTVTAREGRTPPADLAGGTFTITNVGVFGVDTGTPILNPGEAGILALGSVKQAPWVLEGQLAVRTVCQLALSFDHRLVDGEQGSRFLADVGALLADPGLAITY